MVMKLTLNFLLSLSCLNGYAQVKSCFDDNDLIFYPARMEHQQ